MTEPSARALGVAVYLLVSIGVVALFLGGLIGAPGLALLTGLVVGSWWQEPLRRQVERIAWLGAALVALGSLGLAAGIVTSAPSMLDVFTQLLVFLLLVKLYTRRTRRDARDVAFLTFFMLVAASPVTTSIVFLGLFVSFLVVGTWLMMLRHVSNEADDATPSTLARPATLGFGRDLFGLSLVASAATIVVAGLLFVIVPRIGQAALPMQPGGTRMVSGFSERVRLGAFGEIELDAAVVMRVHLTQLEGGRGAPEALPLLRWRGIAFDHFDGREWRVSRATPKLTLRREVAVPFAIQQHYGGPVLTQEIHLEPLGSAMIFGAPRVLRLQGRSDVVTIDDLGLHELERVGLLKEPVKTRLYGAQALGCNPIVDAVRRKSIDIRPVKPNTIAKSLAIGNPADGYYASGFIQSTGGWADDATDAEISEGISLLAETQGIYTETAGGVSIAVLKKLVEQGHIDRRGVTVVAITGNGLKTPEAVAMDSPEVIDAKIDAFERVVEKGVAHVA
jgi:hypothetical protein